MALSDLLHPIDSASEYAKQSGGEQAPAPVEEAHQGSRVTDLGWLVLGTVLIGSVVGLSAYAMHLYLSPSRIYARARTAR